MATYDTFQVALDLVQDQRLSLQQLGNVIQSLIQKYQISNTMLIRHFDDLIRRRVLGLSTFEMIKNYLIELKIISHSWAPQYQPLKEKIVENGHVYQLDGLFEPWIKSNNDYLNNIF